MTSPTHLRIADLRGLRRLATDATLGLADLVEAMHHTIARRPGVLGTAPEGRTTGITGFVYGSVRGVARLVGVGVDGLLAMLPPLLAERPSTAEREAVLAALNGIFGDYLEATRNPLAISMQLRRDGQPLVLTRDALAAAVPEAGKQLVVLVHGLCMNDLQWRRDDGHDHGAALARDLGRAVLYLHYNSGRHVSSNGRDLSALLESLVVAWPAPVESLAIVGHSMGGLVARSAAHYGGLAGRRWVQRLTDLVFLGTPHHGAPLERAGALTDYLLGISPYTAPLARLGKVRSAGIRDLRCGNVRDEERGGLPLPAGVNCVAIAGSKQARPAGSATRLRGDGLVPVRSALGQHRDAAVALAIPADHRFIAYEAGHFELLQRRDVYARIARALGSTSQARRGR